MNSRRTKVAIKQRNKLGQCKHNAIYICANRPKWASSVTMLPH